MKKNHSVIAFTIFLSSFFLSSCGTPKWQNSFEAAKTKAAKSNQEIFMVIAGGEASSTDFKNNVLDSKTFLSAMAKKYTLLYTNLSVENQIDFTPEQLEKAFEENSKITRDYNITDELTMLRLSPEGYWLADYPFLSKYQDPAELVADIKNSDEKVAEIKNIILSIKKSSGTDKVKAIDSLYEITDDRYKAAILPLCHEIPSLDDSNSTGLLGKYEIINAYDDADKILSKENVAQAAKKFTAIAEGGHLDRSQKFEAYFTAAYLYALVGSTDYDTMIKLLEKAYESNPADSHAKEATALLETIQNMKIIYEDSLKAYNNESADDTESSNDNEKKDTK